jgi:hypothetical protein
MSNDNIIMSDSLKDVLDLSQFDTGNEYNKIFCNVVCDGYNEKFDVLDFEIHSSEQNVNLINKIFLIVDKNNIAKLIKKINNINFELVVIDKTIAIFKTKDKKFYYSVLNHGQMCIFKLNQHI